MKPFNLSDHECRDIAAAINGRLAPKGLICWGWKFSISPGARYIKFKCKIGKPEEIEKQEIPTSYHLWADLWPTPNL